LLCDGDGLYFIELNVDVFFDSQNNIVVIPILPHKYLLAFRKQFSPKSTIIFLLSY